MKLKRRIVFLFLIVMVASMIYGSSVALGADNNDKLNEIMEKGKMLVVMDASYPPLDFTNPESGKIEGLLVDIVTLYAEQLGVEIELRDSSWSGIIPGIMNGDYDIAATHLTRTVLRTTKITLSDPYMKTGTVGIIKLGSPITKFSDLNSKNIKIGASKGGVYIDMIESNFPEAELLLFDSKMDWTEALKVGRIDCVFDAEIAALDMFKIYKDTFAILPEGYYDSETYGFAVKYGEWGLKNSLDLFLQEIKFSGKYAELFEKWMGTPWVPTADISGV